MKPTLLTPDAVLEALSSLPGWKTENRELVRQFQFKTYLEGVDFVRQAAEQAEAMNHHPDLVVGWRKVSVRISTHSVGGLTPLDFQLAQRITALAPPSFE